MAFGPRMQLDVPQQEGEPLKVELAPLTREAMPAYVAAGGFQDYSVSKFMTRRDAPTLEDEYEWFDKVRANEQSVNWGIWLIEGDKRTLVGGTGLHAIEHGPTGLKQATSGIAVFKPFWGKGIATHAHRARTWFAFNELGLTRIKSAVIHGNAASRKALEACGYIHAYVERNTTFVEGKLRHQDNLECLNPLKPFWGNWWEGDTPSNEALAARQRSLDAMEWAKAHMILP